VSNIRLFAGDCIIYRKIIDSSDIDNLQTDLNRLGEWTVENEIKINPGKSKAVSFTTGRVKERVRYYFGDQLIPEASSFKYLVIITRIDLNWADHVNCIVGSSFHNAYTQRGNNNTKRLAYTALVRPILKYGAVCWDRYREAQVSKRKRLNLHII